MPTSRLRWSSTRSPASPAIPTPPSWEDNNQCGFAFHYACWDWGNFIPVGGYNQLVKTTIWVHPGNFPGLSPAWQITSGAHEWGHNLSLDHHNEETPCNLPGVMGLASVSQEPDPCFQAPAGRYSASSASCTTPVPGS